MNPTALITGAGGGLGSALAHAFATAGYDLILHTRESALPEIRSKGVRVIPIFGDLNDALVNKRIKDTASKYDIDIFINNAAVYHRNSFHDASAAELIETVCTNLSIAMNTIKDIWPVFERNREGTIININSLAGKQAGKNQAAYSASKMGMRGFLQGLQYDATEIGVNITDVFLGSMKTPMAEGRDDYDLFMDPKEVAEIIVGLCQRKVSLRIPEITISRRLY